jgi:hypothetical protein
MSWFPCTYPRLKPSGVIDFTADALKFRRTVADTMSTSREPLMVRKARSA